MLNLSPHVNKREYDQFSFIDRITAIMDTAGVRCTVERCRRCRDGLRA